MEKAIKNGGDNDFDILEHYGDILYNIGKIDEAVEYWQKAFDKSTERNDKCIHILKEKIKEKKYIECNQ